MVTDNLEEAETALLLAAGLALLLLLLLLAALLLLALLLLGLAVSLLGVAASGAVGLAVVAGHIYTWGTDFFERGAGVTGQERRAWGRKVEPAVEPHRGP